MKKSNRSYSAFSTSLAAIAAVAMLAATGCGKSSGGSSGVGTPGNEGGHQGGLPSGELMAEPLQITHDYEPWKLNRFVSGPRVAGAIVVKRFVAQDLAYYHSLKLSYGSHFASCQNGAAVEYRFSIRSPTGTYAIAQDQEVQLSAISGSGAPYEVLLEALTTVRCESITYDFAILGKRATGAPPIPGPGPGGPLTPVPPTPLPQPSAPAAFPQASAPLSQAWLATLQKRGQKYCELMRENFVVDQHGIFQHPQFSLLRDAELKLYNRVCSPAGDFMGHSGPPGANESAIAAAYALWDAANGARLAVSGTYAQAPFQALKVANEQMLGKLFSLQSGGAIRQSYPNVQPFELAQKVFAYRLWAREMNEWARRQ